MAATFRPKLKIQLDLDAAGVLKGVKVAQGGLGKLEAAASKTGGVFGELVKGMGGFLRQAASFAGGFLLYDVIRKITGAIGGLISAFEDFDAEMANVNSIVQLSDQGIAQLSDDVLRLAEDRRIVDMPAQLAAGLYQIVSSGFEAADAMKVLEAASIAATAGLTTTDVASTALVAVLNAYHLGADQAAAASNSLFQIVNLGVLTFEQLAGTIGTVVPTAAALGVTLDELGGAYTVLTRQGVSADEATTQIYGVINGLLKPTEALTAALNDLGYESGEALIAQKGFGGALEVVRDLTGGSADKAAEYFGDIRALRGILGLTTNDMADYEAAMKGMSEAQEGAGATQKALEKQMKSARFQLRLLHKNVVLFFTEGVGRKFTAAVAGAAGFINRFFDAMFKLRRDGLSPLMAAFAAVQTVVAETFGSKWAARVTRFMDAILTGGRYVRDIMHDLQEAIGVNGLSGALAIVAIQLDRFLPPSLTATLITAAELVGNLTGNLIDLAGALIAGDWSGAWDAVKTTVTDLASDGIDLGKVTLRAGFDLVGDAVADFKGWLLGKLGMGQRLNASTGDLTGGGGYADFSLGEVVVAALLKFVFDGDPTGDFKADVKAILTAEPILVTPEVQLDIKTGVANWVRDNPFDSITWGELVTAAKWSGLVAVLFQHLPVAVVLYLQKEIAPAVRSAIAGFFEGLFKGQPAAEPGLGGMTVTKATWFQTFVDGLVESFKSLPGLVLARVKSGEFGSVLAGLFAGIETDIEAVKGVIQSIKDIDIEKPAFITTLENLIKGITDAWNALMKLIGKGGKEEEGPIPAPTRDPVVPSETASAVDPRKIIAGALGGMVGEAKGFNFAGKLKSVFGGTQVIDVLSKPFEQGRLKVAVTVAGMAQDVTRGLTTLKGQAISITQATALGISMAFWLARNGAVNAIASLASTVIGQLNGLRGAAAIAGAGIGNAIGAGLYNTLIAWASRVAAAAASLVTTAIFAARVAALAFSPSRKMMDLGEDMVAGLLIPLKTLPREVGAVMGAAMPGPGHAFVPGLAGAGAMGGAAAGGLSLSVRVDGNVYGIESMTEAVAKEMGPALAQLWREQRRRLGRP